jgi:hypothetical protein
MENKWRERGGREGGKEGGEMHSKSRKKTEGGTGREFTNTQYHVVNDTIRSSFDYLCDTQKQLRRRFHK